MQFWYLSRYAGIITIVLFFTQFPIRRILKLEHLTYGEFILLLALDVVLVSLIIILLYRNSLTDVLYALKYTTPAVLLPYFFALIILYSIKQRDRWKTLGAASKKNRRIHFRDDRNKLIFSVPPKELLIIESSDNYVSIYHLLNGKVKRQILRKTMNSLEALFQGSTMIRCHRSYMVNVEHMEYVKKEGKKLQVKVHAIDNPLPVSNKYRSLFLDYITKE